jgi:hypothetical protein
LPQRHSGYYKPCIYSSTCRLKDFICKARTIKCTLLFNIASEDPILLDENKPAIEIALMDYELWPNKRKFIYHKDKKLEVGELWKIAGLDISQRGYYIY